jgi:hypothetical protein
MICDMTVPRMPANRDVAPPPIVRLETVWLSPDYCGCCGQLAGVGDYPRPWCDRCADHVGEAGPLWERTWFALTRRDCPFTPPPRQGL